MFKALVVLGLLLAVVLGDYLYDDRDGRPLRARKVGYAKVYRDRDDRGDYRGPRLRQVGVARVHHHHRHSSEEEDDKGRGRGRGRLVLG
ncbi:unnamed protein product [Bursaphelenchus xylophilus]|uniref:(pine wood nematode) hypothetical protein n=1 Tax=Bursaphelenchus xylophilus TaxID=6326 RepID=A0A1I7RUD8_BURXY|nr:unnamed protein product [Bursaphelenchus xylophilus]CAG9114058.1 unnamed protein product [Bursaphelenchus xylophilus]